MDETNETQSQEQTVDVENEVVETQDTSTEQVVTDKTSALAQTEVEIPKKFIKEDGSIDYERLTKSYVELEKRIGSKMPATDPTEYEYTAAREDLFTEADVQDFKNIATEIGLSKDQYSAALKVYEDYVSKVVDHYAETPEKCNQVLAETWGKDLKSNLQYAQKAFEAFAPQDLDIDSIGNNPNIIKLLASIGKQIGEDSGLSSQKVKTGSRLSAIEVADLRNRPDYYSPEVQRLVQEYYNETYKGVFNG